MLYEKRKILFGSIAGITEALIMQPIDTLKVLRQSNQPLPNFIKNPSHYYKGITPFVSQMSVKYTLRFTAYETLKGETFSRNFLAGIAAGFTESLFITPFELVKTNLQTTNENRPTEVVKNIIKLKGISGLYRGFFSTFLSLTFECSIWRRLVTSISFASPLPVLSPLASTVGCIKFRFFSKI